MDEPLMKIGEIAAFFGVSVKALRLYEKKGIIRPVKVDPFTGYRYYNADQVKHLNALLDLKKLGFSLKEIKKIMAGGTTGDQFVEAMTRKRMAWQDAIALAEDKIDTIDKILERLSKSKNAVRLQEMTEEERAWLLSRMVCIEDLGGQNILSEAIWL